MLGVEVVLGVEGARRVEEVGEDEEMARVTRGWRVSCWVIVPSKSRRKRGILVLGIGILWKGVFFLLSRGMSKLGGRELAIMMVMPSWKGASRQRIRSDHSSLPKSFEE